MKASIITPAYSRDLHFLEISADSVDRYCPPEIHHFVIVSRHEHRLFKHLNSSRRTVLVTEEVVPPQLYRFPFLVKRKELWLVDWMRPVRGWIMQQAVKLAGPDISDADILLYLDTDVFLIRPFSLDAVVQDGRVALMRKPGEGTSDNHKRWHRVAGSLLGIPPQDYYGADFIGHLIAWRRDICLELRSRIEAQSGEAWFKLVTKQLHLAEFILYGVFVQEVLGAADARHHLTDHELCLESWDFMADDGDPKVKIARHLRPEHLAVNIQSNLRLAPREYRSFVDAASAVANAA